MSAFYQINNSPFIKISPSPYLKQLGMGTGGLYLLSNCNCLNIEMSAHTPVTDSSFIKIPPSPLLKRLGVGTGVDVYLVERSPECGMYRSPWAVKKLSKKSNGDKRTYMQRLKDEAAILQDLHHKNIVGFRGFVENGDGECILVMEDGQQSLLSLIEERSERGLGPFPVDSIGKVAVDVAHGLSYLHHEKLLLHGDVKSSNVLIQGNFEIAKLCDFGVSLRLDENLNVRDSHSKYVGTEPWSALEVLREQEVSNKADIYSYSMLLYEMLTLCIPHMHVFPKEENFHSDESFEDAWELAEEVYQQRLGSRPPLNEHDYDISYSLIIQLFCACSQESPQARPSADQIVQLLGDVTLSDPTQKLVF